MTRQSDNSIGEQGCLSEQEKGCLPHITPKPHLSGPGQGLGVIDHTGFIGKRVVQQAQVNSIVKQFTSGDLSAYGHDPEARQRNREFWERVFDDAQARNDIRAANRATKVLHMFAEFDLKLALEVDKASRLDAGESTENYTFGPVRFRGDRKVGGDDPERVP